MKSFKKAKIDFEERSQGIQSGNQESTIADLDTSKRGLLDARWSRVLVGNESEYIEQTGQRFCLSGATGGSAFSSNSEVHARDDKSCPSMCSDIYSLWVGRMFTSAFQGTLQKPRNALLNPVRERQLRASANRNYKLKL